MSGSARSDQWPRTLPMGIGTSIWTYGYESVRICHTDMIMIIINNNNNNGLSRGAPLERREERRRTRAVTCPADAAARSPSRRTRGARWHSGRRAARRTRRAPSAATWTRSVRRSAAACGRAHRAECLEAQGEHRVRVRQVHSAFSIRCTAGEAAGIRLSRVEGPRVVPCRTCRTRAHSQKHSQVWNTCAHTSSTLAQLSLTLVRVC